LFFGHNLPTTNAIKPIKGSKDGDFCLVYITRKKQKIAPCGWAPGPDDIIQKTLYLPQL